jgi:serine/threonine protein kinase
MQPTFEQLFFAIAIKQKLLTASQAQALIALIQQGTPEEIKELAVKAGVASDVADQIAVHAQKLVDKYAAEVDAKRTAPLPAVKSDKPSNPQEVIPGYRFVKKLGVGGTATVFLADTDKEFKKAAVKILHPKKAADEKQRERFMREARLLTDFGHPNIVKGYEYGTHNNLYFFSMEVIDGMTVQEMLDKSGAIEETKALEIIVDVARGLDYMHAKGYVHKDVKPGNIMLTRDGHVKLCDLGFAQPMYRTEPEKVDRLAETDTTTPAVPADDDLTVGTVQFMSPEQAQGKRDLDVRSDIYSLGATLFYMVMGELPFKGETDMDLMAKHVMEELDSAAIKDRQISQHMHYFIERMMSKDRDLRYPTPGAMIDDITQQIEGFKRVQNAKRMTRQDTSVLRKPSVLKSGDTQDVKPMATPPAEPEVKPAQEDTVLRTAKTLRSRPPGARFSALSELRDKFRRKPKR